MTRNYIKIKDKEIPVIVRNYINTKHVKIYFRGNVLNISKPKRLSIKEMLKIIKDNEENIYKEYMDIISVDSKKIKHWVNGENILYKGEQYTIIRKYVETNKIKIEISEEQKQFKIEVPNLEDEELLKMNIDSAIKKLFKNNTEVLLTERLPYWSKITKIEYNNFKVRDTISKFGSCVPSKKSLNFASRLIMLPIDKIDGIIVHELCHIIYPNHSKGFYDLVKSYIPNYEQIDKWLSKNVGLIAI